MSAEFARRTQTSGTLGALARVPARTWSQWALTACILAAVVARVVAILVVSHAEIRRAELRLNADEPSFHDTAKALATTGNYSQRPGGPATAFRPPGAILPLAALYYVFGPTPYVAFVYVMLCGVGVVVAVYMLADATFHDRRVAVTAALLAAVLPTQVFTSSGIWSEPQAILLTLLLLYLLVRGDVGGMREGSPPYQGGVRGGLKWSANSTCLPWKAWGSWLLVGLCGSLAYLTRPSAVFVFPFLIVGAWFSGRGWTRAINTALLVGALLLPISAWGLRNWLTFGECITGATVAGEALYGSNNSVTAGISLPAKPTRDSFDLYKEAREGCYLGSWVPMQYIPGWDLPADAAEIEVYHRQMESVAAFVRQHPWSWVRLLGYKVLRLLTVEPYAPSITYDVGTRRIAHRIATVIEHWFIVGWGGAGMILLFRSGNRWRYWYSCFLAAGLANVLVAYPNPRFLLPLTSILIVPAALALTRAHDGWRSRAACQP